MIFKDKFIKSYLSDLTEQLKDANINLPHLNELADILLSVNPKITSFKHALSLFYETFNIENLRINQNFLEQNNTINHDLKKETLKHQNELEKAQLIMNKQLKVLNMTFKHEQHHLTDEMKKIEESYRNKIDDATAIYTQELALENKTKPLIRKKYRLQTNKIQHEKDLEMTALDSKLKEALLELDQQFSAYETSYKISYEQISHDYEQFVLSNDRQISTYKLLITNQGILMNQLINAAKSRELDWRENLTKAFDLKQTEIYAEIRKIDSAFQVKTNELHQNYQAEEEKKNAFFAKQKVFFDAQKEVITTDYHNELNALNSSYSVDMAQLNQQKKQTQNQMNQEILHAKTTEQSTIRKNGAVALKSIDYRMKTLILNNKKAIASLQASYQKKQFDQDVLYLKEMTRHELSSKIDQIKREQDLSLLNAEYKRELNVLHTNLEKEKMIFDAKLSSIGKINLKTLYTYELQGQLNKNHALEESNLMANDAQIKKTLNQIALDNLMYEEHLFKLDIEQKRNDISIQHERDRKICHIKAQIDIEREKSVRNFSLDEIELRKKIQAEMFDFEKYLSSYDKAIQILNVEYQLDLLKENHKFTSENYKQLALHEYTKRQYYINLEKYKFQEKENVVKTKRIIAIHRAELNRNQAHSNTLFSVLYHQEAALFYTIHFLLSSEELFEDISLYSNVIRKTIALIGDFTDSMQYVVSHYKSLDIGFFEKKIEETIGYKYMLRHGELLSLIEQEREKISIERNQLSLRINALEQELFSSQANRERYTSLLFDEKTFLLPLKRRKDQKQIKEHRFTIKRYEANIKQLSHKITSNEKKIFKLNRELLLLDKNQELLKKQLQHREALLMAEKKAEGSTFYQGLHQNDELFSLLLAQLYKQSALLTKELNKLLTDSSLSIVSLKKKMYIYEQQFKNKIESVRSLFLSHYLSIFNQTLSEQNHLIETFYLSTKAMNRKLDDTFSSHQSEYDRQVLDRTKSNVSVANKLRAELNRNLQAQKLALDVYSQTHHDIIRKLNQKIDDNHHTLALELDNLTLNESAVINDCIQEASQHERSLYNDFKKESKKAYAKLSDQKDANELTLQALNAKENALLNHLAQANSASKETFKSRLQQIDFDLVKIKNNTEKALRTLDFSLRADQNRITLEVKGANRTFNRTSKKLRLIHYKNYMRSFRKAKQSYHFRLKNLK